jgi:hypothetical protein
MKRLQMLFGSMILLGCSATAQQTAPTPAPSTSSDTSALEQKAKCANSRRRASQGHHKTPLLL